MSGTDTKGESSVKNSLSKSTRLAVSSILAALVLILSAGWLTAADSKDLLSNSEVKQLVTNAKTAADHMKLARHFAAKAEQHEADAKEHEALAAEYRRNPGGPGSKQPMSGRTAEHCQFYANHCRTAAKELRSMDAMHEEMAKNLGK